MLGKGGRQRKWCAPAAMEPIVGASRTSDSVDYWHYTHSKSTCWKRSMTTTSFHSSKLLRMHAAMSAGAAPPGETQYASQENSSVKQWRNLSFSTVSHILLCTLESLEPWGNVFVSNLVWGVWCSVSVTLQSAQCFTFDVLYATDTRVLFFPSQAQDALRVTGEERGKLLTC